MGNTKIKIAIIGAGPNGIASAMPFLEHKDKFDVTLISSGESLFSEEIIISQKILSLKNYFLVIKLSTKILKMT